MRWNWNFCHFAAKWIWKLKLFFPSFIIRKGSNFCSVLQNMQTFLFRQRSFVCILGWWRYLPEDLNKTTRYQDWCPIPVLKDSPLATSRYGNHAERSMMTFGRICLFDKVAPAPNLRCLTLPKGSRASTDTGFELHSRSQSHNFFSRHFSTLFLCCISPHFVMFACSHYLVCSAFQHITYSK